MAGYWLTMQHVTDRSRGIAYALAAAALFGVTTPFAKVLLPHLDPWLLAGLLYLGSGVGLSLVRSIVKLRVPIRADPLSHSDLPWLAAAIACGGVVGPVLLLFGLQVTPASTASLLLNLEEVFTALLAWFVFRENFDTRIAIGMALISAGAVTLSWTAQPEFGGPWGTLSIAGACLAWAVDNNFTRRISGSDPVTVAMLKGLWSGIVNTILAFILGARLPGADLIVNAGFLGFVGYGISLALFVVALRYLGTARTGAYFSTAPFVGAAVSIAWLRESPAPGFLSAAFLIGSGVWLHVTERHEHLHVHEALEHQHPHVHDEHHEHTHAPGVLRTQSHTHPHRHDALRHKHPHYPDLHHRHGS